MQDTLNTSASVSPVISIARVRASEATRLSDFSAALFDQTYGPVCRAADVDAYIAEHLSASAWLAELTDATGWVFAVVIDDQWAGYAHVKLSALPEGVPLAPMAAPSVTPLEICRFYVLRKWHGQGVAVNLLNSVLAHATSQGSPTVWLTTWQENARAIAFYEKWRFLKTGTATFLMGEELQQDYIMRRELLVAAAASDSVF